MNILVIIILIIVLLLSHNFGSYLNRNHFHFINENDKSIFRYILTTTAGFVFLMFFGIIIYMGYELLNIILL